MITVIGVNKNNEEVVLEAQISKSENKTTVLVKKELTFNKDFETVRIINTMTKISARRNGYIFYPTDLWTGVIKTELKERADARYVSDVCMMPVAGICEDKDAVMILATSGGEDVRFHVSVTDNVYEICPEFQLDGDNSYVDLCVEYHSMPGATYSDMARAYRKYQMECRGCIPISERIKDNPYLEYAAESMEFRVRMGWKPVPTPVWHQTLENEPPLKVVCDIKKLMRLVDLMKQQGIKKAEICLVGWAAGGHDGRFPQNYPVDERYGTDAELKEFVSYAQSLGYHIVCHTNSVIAYEIANNWDINALTHKKDEDGNTVPHSRDMYNSDGGLSGGFVYHLCAKTAYEQYAAKDLPRIAEYGFKGIHFVDELTAVPPEKCYHKEHPVSRQEALESYRRIMRLSKELFGGYQSEGWIDYMNSDLDYIMYASFINELDPETKHTLFDDIIPFWQLVYHGIVLYNPNSHTVNFVLKDPKVHLRFIEFGGRPLMYLHSKFGERKNWMGDIDLNCETEEQLIESVHVLKEAADEYEPLVYLQYEFMENHEKLEEGVYKTSYSDGTSTVVNYNTNSYFVEKNGDVIISKQL